MKSLMWLVVRILEDSGIQCSTNVLRDVQRVQTEVEHRGMSFLTLTLPAFGDAFDESLDRGRVDLVVFPSILRKRYRSGGGNKGLPAFLRGFLNQVFSLDNGVILDDPSETAIFAIRQICRAAKKLDLSCSAKRMRQAIERFTECDAEIADSDYVANWDGRAHFVSTSRVLWSEVAGGFSNFRGSADDIKPKHGPGATAERVSGNGKYRSAKWTRRLQGEFPADSFIYASLGHLLDEGCGEDSLLEFHDPKDELPVRVRFVPKTMKGPRVIAIEPVCMQYAQQAVMEWLVEKLETSRPTAGHLNFRDQGINQQEAMKASKNKGGSATIDLSEASDRVSAIMVRDMLGGAPQLRDAVFACRSSRAELPNGDVIVLRKFASMGSALCFPVEAMIFYTIIASALLRERSLRITLRNIEIVMQGVYIYGDDIIVPKDVVDIVVLALGSSGLKVNAAKSFWNGQFRESCGMDAYNGIAVKPVYVRRMLPSDKQSSEEIISAISAANQFYEVGYWRTASHLRQIVERLVGTLPYVRETSPGLGWTSFLGYQSVQRWNRDLHRFEVKTLKIIPRRKTDVLDGYPALLKFFLKRGDNPSDDEKHLQETVQSGTANIKRRWLTAC